MLETKSAVVTANGQTTFTFSDQIVQRMVGIQAFSLSYGSTDHHVQTLSLSLLVNQSGSQLQVSPAATLVDNNGHNLDPSSSSITVVAVAWVGVNDDNLVLGNSEPVPNGSSSRGIAIPTPNPLILQAVLSGFDFSYGDTDHHMETLHCSVGCDASGNSATIRGQAQMYDDNGHNATLATVSGGLIANGDSTLRVQSFMTNNLQNSTQTLNFADGLSNFVPLLSSFRMQYKNDSDHHVMTLSANLSVQSRRGTSVVVTGLAHLIDDSGNAQDDGGSHVTGIVLGY